MKKIIILLVLLIFAGLLTKAQLEQKQELSLEIKNNCKVILHKDTEDIYDICQVKVNLTTCTDEPFNTSCTTKQITKEEICLITQIPIEIPEIVCEKPSYTYGEKRINNEWKCNLQTLMCDSCRDGNCDGIVQSGESYIDLKEDKYRKDDRRYTIEE